MGRAGTCFLLLALAVATVTAVREQGYCRDMTCASREDLLSALQVMRKEIQEKDAAVADSNCTACYSSPCLNGGTCLPDGKTGYRCDCPDATAGANCEKVIQCTTKTCGANAECFVQNHQTNCVCKFGYSGDPIKGCTFKSKKICATGDPHYVTFDGLKYDYMATCPYTYSTPCTNLTGGYSNYLVKARNFAFPGKSVSYVDSVYVEFYGQRIFVNKELDVFFNDIRVNIPYYYPSSSAWQISITMRGNDVVIKNNQFIEVDFHYSSLCLVIPDVPALRGAGTICGLSGNLDGLCNDDLRLPDGTLVPVSNCTVKQPQASADDFGDKWRTNDYPQFDNTVDACVDGHIMTNTSKKCDITQAVPLCSVIFDAQNGKGILKNCAPMGVETISNYYDNCLYDTCRDPTLKCTALEAFVHECQAEIPGVDISGWRDDPAVSCPSNCPPHSEYSNCVSSCPATCASHDAPDTCDQPCFEGCKCSYGYVLDTTDPSQVTCVAVDDCGCSDDKGNFHPAHTHWLTNNCQQDNFCSNGTYNRAPYGCSPDGHCDILNSRWGCVCNTGFQGDGQNCTDINECLDPTVCHADSGHGVCVNTVGSYYCQCKEGYDGDNCDRYAPSRHCADLRLYHNITTDGVYKIYPSDKCNLYPPSNPGINVICDMTTDGGGWTLMGNSVGNHTANRTFADYSNGWTVSTDKKDQWLGLNTINCLTTETIFSMRVNLQRCPTHNKPAKSTYCTYDFFAVSDSKDGYRVNITKDCEGTEDEYYDGWARWDLTKPGPTFAAFDMGDETVCKCSWMFHNTGWWYDTTNDCCGSANLNGIRYECDNKPLDSGTYLFWNGNPLSQADMWLRPYGYPNYV